MRSPTISITLQEVGFFLLWFISTFWANLRGQFSTILWPVFMVYLWPDLRLIYSLLKGQFGTVLWPIFMASLWLDLGLIYSLLNGCLARFCGLFMVIFEANLRGCLAWFCGLFLWHVSG